MLLALLEAQQRNSDLLHLPCNRGQMSAEEVSVVMWQLLQALKFLHHSNVWHRYLATYLTICTPALYHEQSVAAVCFSL